MRTPGIILMSTVETICTTLLSLIVVVGLLLVVGAIVLDMVGVDVPTLLEEWGERRHERKMLKISKKYEHDKAKKLDASKPKMF